MVKQINFYNVKKNEDEVFVLPNNKLKLFELHVIQLEKQYFMLLELKRGEFYKKYKAVLNETYRGMQCKSGYISNICMLFNLLSIQVNTFDGITIAMSLKHFLLEEMI